MRIGLNNTPDPQSVLTGQTEQSKKSTAAANNQPDPTLVGDQANLSEDQVTLSSLATQALAQPEVRQGLVDSLRQSISSGQYQLDPNAIAGAILNQE